MSMLCSVRSSPKYQTSLHEHEYGRVCMRFVLLPWKMRVRLDVGLGAFGESEDSTDGDCWMGKRDCSPRCQPSVTEWMSVEG